MKNRMDILEDLPSCFARYDQSRARDCADCAFSELCRKLIYRSGLSDLAGMANQVLEMIEELERANQRIELILGRACSD